MIYILKDAEGNEVANSANFKDFLIFAIKNKAKLEEFDLELTEDFSTDETDKQP